MCTYLTFTEDVHGSGLGREGWFALRKGVVSFDHPEDAPLEHALCIDFRGAEGDPTTRVAVELDAASARRLAQAVLAALDHPEVVELAPQT